MHISNERRAELSDYLRHFTGRDPYVSDVGYRCADLLDELVGGLHHLDQKAMANTNWQHDLFIEIAMPYTCFSSFDFDFMTRLVFLSHDKCIRTEATSPKRGCVGLIMHPRWQRESIIRGHPTLETAVAKWREKHPQPVE